MAECTCRTIKCSLDAAKRKFYRTANGIFGKVGHIASEEVALHLVTSTCMPVSLSGLEVLSLNKSQLSSLDFVANRFCMKLFKTHAVICKLLNFVMYILILNCAATFTVVATKSS